MSLEILKCLSRGGMQGVAAVFLCVGLLAHAAARAAPADAWHADGAPKVVAEEVRFANNGVRLEGTLYLPEQGDHLPAVVVLHSASAAKRDAALYRHLREGLPAIGIAVLIYDRRGSGASSGDAEVTDYETLADDAIAGQGALAAHPRIDPRKIGFWGLSQGGWLAVLAAGRSRNAAFAVSVSAPLVTPERQMEFATANLLTVRGYPRDDVKQMLDARQAWIDYLRGTGSRAAALEALRTAETRRWFDIAFLPASSTLVADPKASTWRRQMDLDPVAAVRSAKVPLLFIFGGSDPWVPVPPSLQQLRLLARERPDITYAVIPGASHEMMFRERETMEIDAKTFNESAPQAPEYFMLLASWLSRHAYGESPAPRRDSK